MPISLPEQTWAGSEAPFATVEQREAIKAGQPFVIYDARTFNQMRFLPDGTGKVDLTAAFLVQLLDSDGRSPDGYKFVWTRTATNSPARQEQVRFIHEQVEQNQDVVGPCCVVQLPSRTPGMSPYLHVTMWKPDRKGGAPIEVGPVAPELAEIDPEDIPF